ncbi:hypothetical protein [Streptomyces griseus]|uniref:hypothetical protein n=1 Tax=Streptomyces griseus TaxID=1911 RepID=UPI0037A21EE2
MIVMQSVLETRAPDGFSLWPVAEGASSRFTALSGNLGPAEIGTVLMLIAGCNDIDPDPGAGDDRPPRPADPLASFLHGLLTSEDPFVSGGLRVVDGATGVTLLPGCCHGLEDWRGMYAVLDGAVSPFLGHDPDPVVERSGESAAGRGRTGPLRLPRPGRRVGPPAPARPRRTRHRGARPGARRTRERRYATSLLSAATGPGAESRCRTGVAG